MDNSSAGPTLSVLSNGGGVALQVYGVNNEDGYLATFNNNSNTSNSYGIQIQTGINSGEEAQPVLINFIRPDSGALGSITEGSDTASVNYNTTSDKRVKSQPVPTAKGLADVLQLSVVDFAYLKDASQTVQTGLISQDVLSVHPTAVYVPKYSAANYVPATYAPAEYSPRAYAPPACPYRAGSPQAAAWPSGEPIRLATYEAREAARKAAHDAKQAARAAAFAADEPARAAAWVTKEAARKASYDDPFQHPQGIDYGKLVPLALRAIQELAAQVTDLKAQLAAVTKA
jgi:hypothetical protein